MWSWWIWLLLILVLLSLIVLIVWLLRLNARALRRRQEAAWTTAQEASHPAALTPAEEMPDRPDWAPAAVESEETAAEAVATEAVATETAVETVQESAEQTASRTPDAVPIEQPLDDLKVIEGIGPKISSVFQAAGIRTLAQLAATDVDELKRILTEADIRLGDPGTWPEQAGLAAEGKWDELAALQDELKGGRRV